MWAYQVPYPPYAARPDDWGLSWVWLLIAYLLLVTIAVLWAIQDPDGPPTD